jgi:hypothetical protein
MELIKNNQIEMFEMKTSVNQIQIIVSSIISRKDRREERIPDMENKLTEILHTNNYKEKWIQHRKTVG